MRKMWDRSRPMTETNRPAHALGLGRHDYYCFLRCVYGMTSLQAWNAAARLPPTVEDIQVAVTEATTP
jgi:hypothetical protein